MKSIASPAMAAIEAGEAIVTGAVEILSPARLVPVFSFDASFAYQLLDEVVDADPPEDVVPPSAGFDSTGDAPFGRDGGGLTPAYPIATAWLPQKSLWLRKQINVAAGMLTLTGHVENGAVFFLDDELIGSINTAVDAGGATGSPFEIEVAVSAGVHTLKILVLDEAENKGSADNTYFYVNANVTVGGEDAAIRVWGGYGPREIDGEIYQGIGDRGLAQQTAGAIGGIAQGMQLTLSGIEPHLLALLDPDEVKGASVIIRRLIFASDGKTLLDASIFDRGRVDAVETIETVGGTAAIVLAVETAARGLGSSSSRMRSDSDQRLIKSTDGYFKNTSYAGEKMLYWGGRRPSTAGASGGTSGGLVDLFRGFLGRSAE